MGVCDDGGGGDEVDEGGDVSAAVVKGEQEEEQAVGSLAFPSSRLVVAVRGFWTFY